MKKIKILYNLGQLGIGGVETQLLELVKHINKRRFEIIVCCFSNKTKLLKEFKKYCKVIILKKILPLDITRVWRIRRVIKQYAPDIIHNDIFTANLWGTLAGKLEKKPVIISYKSTLKYYPLHKRIIDFLLSKLADKIITISHSNVNLLVNKARFNKNKIVIIHEGINTDFFKPKSKAENNKIKIIAIIGRLTEQKNHKLFLDTAKIVLEKHPEIKFLIVGDGKLRKELENYTNKLGIEEDVKFLGETKRIKEIYEKTDILASTSSWEGTPIVIIEAMAMNKPVLATSVGGVNEIIDNKINGFLVEPENAEKLAKKLIYLIENPKIARKAGEKAREKIIKNFNIKRKVKEMGELYQEFIKK